MSTRREQRRIRVRGIPREEPDLRKLSRALIELALSQAQAEADAEAEHKREAETERAEEETDGSAD
jgi:hypothetical protein